MLVPTLAVSPAEMMLVENSIEYLPWSHRSPAVARVSAQGPRIRMPEESSHTDPAASQIWLLH